ncbi:unnamed protein product [Lepeophtheirus salmonis]|uniref:(salmon louse) hypothetical protein n=1 Tax=Lepeophtheirus salmonis TaxID=72036 RepID=A0A7R8CRZ7_LEPSM|nr:unnamed protein product [Lepeophtheirus salmonis]CAF2911899.1 unnamed protein product [Lepeophtheirus salmonis]
MNPFTSHQDRLNVPKALKKGVECDGTPCGDYCCMAGGPPICCPSNNHCAFKASDCDLVEKQINLHKLRAMYDVLQYSPIPLSPTPLVTKVFILLGYQTRVMALNWKRRYDALILI